MRIIKSNSSGWVHKTFPELKDFAWQEGYTAFTVSESQAEKLIRYIANQTEHHRQVSFKDELIRLLEAHGVQYDERYLWR